jgi:DNA replication licensing factor MCM3
MPENAPTGQLSRSIEIVLTEDLVDKTKPGDRVQVNGVYKPISNGQTGSIGTFKTLIIATSIKSVKDNVERRVNRAIIKEI